MVETVRPQMTIWRTRFACWLTKDKNTDRHAFLTFNAELLFHDRNGFVKEPRHYLINTFPVF